MMLRYMLVKHGTVILLGSATVAAIIMFIA